jgi:hypothetical protein
MMSRLLVSALAAALAVTSLSSAANRGGFELLSQREYQSELSARSTAPALVPRAADFSAPTITVVKPDRSKPIQPPVDIEVRFQAAQGASINVSSLRVSYGVLRFDITRRILDAPGVQISASGLRASGARIPSGSHKLVIEVADNLGRVGRQLVEFTVQ